GNSQVVVPAAGPHPPTLQVIAKGCTLCRAGYVAAFAAHVTNSGGDVPVELRGGARFPDGRVFGLLSNDIVFPAGHEAEFEMFSGAIPAEIPVGTYVIEAAIIDQTFGMTISRHSIAVQLVP